MFDPEQELGRLGEQLMLGDIARTTTPLPDDEFASLVRVARQERVTGVLAHAVAGDAIAVTDEQYELAASTHASSMAIALKLEQLLCRVHEILAEGAVDHVVLKGPALAHTAYPDPSIRDFGDVDVLIPAEQIDRGTRLLRADGATRRLAELAPGWDRRFAKSVTLLDRSGYEIDIHRTIAPGVFGLRIDPAHLFAHTQPFTIGGYELRGLTPEGQLLQACVHSAAGNRRVWLSSVCDIVQLTRSERVDLDVFHSLVSRWGAGAAVEQSVSLARERLGGADVSVLADGLQVSDADRHRLARYGRGFTGPALTGFAALRLSEWPAYSRALLWPSSRNLHDRGVTRAGHFRRVARHLGHTGGSST